MRLRRLIDLWVADSDLAKQVVALPWVSDGVDIPERDALKGLLGAAAVDSSLSWKIMEFPWIVEEVTEAEGDVIVALSIIASEDGEFAGNEMQPISPGLADDVR